MSGLLMKSFKHPKNLSINNVNLVFLQFFFNSLKIIGDFIMLSNSMRDFLFTAGKNDLLLLHKWSILGNS